MDNYEWLRDKESAEVVEHLKAENAYQEAVTAHQEPLREAIFQEIKGRTQETDLSVPHRKDGWWYFSRSVEGKEYGIQCRVRASDTHDRIADWTPPAVEPGVEIPGEEVLLDGNIEAEGKPFFSVGGTAVTVDGNLYAYAVDNSGDERFTLRIKDLRTGELLPDVIENIFYGVSFSPDGTRIFYTVVDDSWRPYQVKAHVLGTPVSEDTVIYQEDDTAMWLGFELSSDRRYLVLGIGCSEYSETRLLRFDDPRRSSPPLFRGTSASCTRRSRSCSKARTASRQRRSCSPTTAAPSTPWSPWRTRPSSPSRWRSRPGRPSSSIPTTSASTAPASRPRTSSPPSARTPSSASR